jgi:hypothetical protein
LSRRFGRKCLSLVTLNHLAYAVGDDLGVGFNSSLDGKSRRAIDIHEGDKVDEAALKDLIRAAVALNLKGKSKPKPRRASKRAD